MTEGKLLAQIRQGMEQAVADVDWQTQAKLTRLRVQLLAQQHAQHHLSLGFDFPSFMQGFVVVSAVTLVATLWSLVDHLDAPPPTFALTPVNSANVANQGSTPENKAPVAEPELDITTLDVLLATEDIDFLHDLDMYLWLAEYG
ncbi:MAG: hypothetical protein ACK4RS_00300 [Thiothrix sp.]